MLFYEYFQESAITKAVEAKPQEIEESYYLEISETSLKSPVSIVAFLEEKCIGFALNYILTDIKECFEDPNLSLRNDFTEKIANKGYANPKASKITVVN
uniref:Uncharacterized protein n=1 Tax=Panagrolaimus sp. PS1159 TaxID=55785 RepID=A0AC35FF98_9BILA